MIEDNSYSNERLLLLDREKIIALLPDGYTFPSRRFVSFCQAAAGFEELSLPQINVLFFILVHRLTREKDYSGNPLDKHEKKRREAVLSYLFGLSPIKNESGEIVCLSPAEKTPSSIQETAKSADLNPKILEKTLQETINVLSFVKSRWDKSGLFSDKQKR